jgi:AbrB family looped-hinge helix DNA binding protein
MPSAPTLSTTLSTKGQAILPAAIRKRQQWNAGTRLIVEEIADGVLLKPAQVFPPTVVEEVFGSLHYRGEPKTLHEMQAGAAADVRRRHDAQALRTSHRLTPRHELVAGYDGYGTSGSDEVGPDVVVVLDDFRGR